MTDLQMALVALGAIIIVGVIFFNWWQERSLSREVSQPFTETKRDPLLDDGEFRIDLNAIPEEKLERARPVPAFVQSVPEPATVEPLGYDIPSSIQNHPSYTGAVGDAASAVAEFEDDMAMPVEEVDAQALREAYMHENPADDIAAATSEELMEEAGLDADVEEDPEPKAAAPEEVALPQEISTQIDMIATLQLKSPATGARIREFLLTLTDLDKSVYGYGLASDGWHMLTREEEGAGFGKVLCSLQLVDRSGAATRDAIKRFQQAIAEMAQALQATVEWQGDNDALGYAVELDRFCVEVDKLVGFHLAHGENGPFTGTKLRGMAEAAGMTLHSDGAFYYQAESGQQQYAMVSPDGTPFTAETLRTAFVTGVTFQLDIPHVTNCTEVFNHMVLTARKMATSLGGQLVDANQKPLGEVQLEKIRQELKTIHAKMVARGIIPGSLIAHRLFS
ncbi:MAG TPA: cell division protein ZipA C-terminal FtsZ-binding domain-containing protein [Methylophilaceae bacterium]|nr:cell division protein ZipA C-terminal FtsZ-binding domain-containing protein [Methylophilaceae bacterium]